MDALIQDLRHALRSLRRSPALAITAIGTLTLGIAAATAIFALLDETVLRPLRLPASRELHFVSSVSGDHENANFSHPELQDLRDGIGPAVPLAAFSSLNAVVVGGEEPLATWGEQVSGDYFAVLGARVQLGRPLTPADDRTGAPPVVVLSDGAWARLYGRDPGAIGRTLRLGRASFDIVGVAEAGFGGLLRGFQPAFWLPVATAGPVSGDEDALTTRRSRWLSLAARTDPGRAAEVAARLDGIARAAAGRHADGWAREGPMRLSPAGHGDGWLVGQAGTVSRVLAALVTLLLAIACANLAGLMLARGVERRREMGVRLALGSTRARLVRLLLSESLLLALAGGILGVLLAGPLVRLLVMALPAGLLPMALDPRLDPRVLLVALAAVLASGAAFGMAPALESARLDVLPSLRDAPRTGGWPGRRVSLRGVLIVVQVALSFALLLGASLFARSLQRELALDPGFDPRGRWAMRFDLGAMERRREPVEAFAAELVRRAEALPGVESVSLAQVLQPSRGGNRMGYSAGELGVPNDGEVEFDVNAVGPRYFETLGIPVLAGRDFAASEGLGTRSDGVIVNRSLARLLWRDADPLGRSLPIWGASEPALPVVGIVPDVPLRDLRRSGEPGAYVAGTLSQTPTPTLIVRTAGGPSPLPAIARLARELDPVAATSDPVSLERHLGAALALSRMTTWLLGAFAAIALVLAAMGLHGLLSHAVSRRSRELGVRLALGATRAQVERLVLGNGLRLFAAGAALGALAGVALARAVSGLLFRVPASDGTAWAGTVAGLALAMLLASWWPARRAARLDPARTLRTE